MRARLVSVLAALGLVGGVLVGLASPAGALSTVTMNPVVTSTGVTGSTASDSASVIGDVTPTVTGTVTYTLFPGTACSGTALAPSSTVSVNADGTTFPSYAPANSLSAGSYSFQALFNGPDSNGNTANNGCQPFTIGAATPALTSTVVIAGTSTAWGGSQPVGNSAQDTALLGSNAGILPNGTVTYNFYSSAGCTGAAVSAPVTVSGGLVPNSNPSGALASGSYSFLANFTSIDGNYNNAPGSCENFSVAQSGSGTVTFTSPTVFDASVSPAVPWAGTETTGATAYQTVTVTGVGGIVPTGTVTASLYPTQNCSSTATQTFQFALSTGAGQSAATTPLAAGSYSYQDVYGGDANYAGGAVSPCTTFNVAKGNPTVASVVYNAGTNAPWPANPSPATGSKAFDTSTVTQSAGVSAFPATGTVTYEFFQLGAGTPCTTTPISTEVVPLASGNVPSSSKTASLNKGSYAFEALYSGDGNWLAPTTGTCETFNVAIGTPSTPSIVNIPGGPVEFTNFQASVATNGDGQTSVTSNSSSVCTVGPDGHTVTFVLYGTCSLTAFVGVGNNYGAASGSPQTFTIKAAARGYWLVGSDGGIFSYGAASFHGSMGGKFLQRPVVGITPTADHNGYWLVATDGGVFAFGSTTFYGSIPGLGLNPAGSGLPHSLNAPVVGIVPSATQHGYFMVATDGGVFAFGDAHFAGSCPGIGGCAGNAVAVVPDRTGRGYWLVTSLGNVYAFGDAGYYGATPYFGVPVVDAMSTPDGGGYWILYGNGRVSPFGDAASLGGPIGYVNGFNPATAIFTTADGHGYWVSSARGDVFSYGNAPFLGGLAATNLNGPIIAANGF